MSKTSIKIPYSCGEEEARKRLNEILTKDHFVLIGENLWERRTPWIPLRRYIQSDWEGELCLHIWLKPQQDSDEVDLEQFRDRVPKKQMLNLLTAIEKALK